MKLDIEPPPVPGRPPARSPPAAAFPGLRAGQAEAALLGRVLGAGHPRRDDEDVRRRHQGRLRLRGLLRRQPVQAGHRTRRPPARQPGDGQHRPAGHLQADSGLVDRDRRLPLPRRRASQGVLRQRVRRRDEEDGRGPARREGSRADLFRRAPGRPEAGQGDQDAGRHGRHQAAHAGRRRLAVPRARRSAPTRRRWPMPRSIPACRPARSTARTIRCPTSRT